MTRYHQIRRLLENEAGAVAIETAIAMPILLLLSLGGFQISSLVARQTELQAAMAEAQAVALATDPDVLLLEHPTASLARAHVPAFAAVVAHVASARRLTALIITEDSEFADAVATAHYRLQAGTGALVNARGWRRWFEG